MISSGGPRNTPPGTLTQLYFDALARYDKPDALQVKVKGVYQPISSRTIWSVSTQPPGATPRFGHARAYAGGAAALPVPWAPDATGQ